MSNKDNNKNFIDVDYSDSEENNKRRINGEPLFYTTTQVSEMVGIPASKVRFWTTRFEKLLDVEISNRNRQYKKSDVEKLIFIKRLADEDGLTLQQIEDYCTEKKFDVENIETSVLNANNPIAIQAFTSAVMTEVDKKLSVLQDNLIKSIEQSLSKSLNIQEELNKKLHQEVAITVEEVVTEKLKESHEQYECKIDELEQNAIKRDSELSEKIRIELEERKMKSEQEKSKGIFSWFKKKKER